MNWSRVEHWPRILHEYFDEKRPLPGVWGERDCVLFALGGAERITGADVTSDLRGQYSSPLGAAKIMRRMGCETLREACDVFCERFGGKPIDPMYAQRGDLGFIPNEAGGCLAICEGQSWASFAIPEGFVLLPFVGATAAWKI